MESDLRALCGNKDIDYKKQWEKDLRAEGISEYHLEVSMEIMRRASPDDPIMKYCLAPVPRPNLEAENLSLALINLRVKQQREMLSLGMASLVDLPGVDPAVALAKSWIWRILEHWGFSRVRGGGDTDILEEPPSRPLSFH
jgi:hypothetical protein